MYDKVKYMHGMTKLYRAFYHILLYEIFMLIAF